MNIRITEYTRDDGVVMLQHTSGKWLIRKILGPAWFYKAGFGWVIVTTIGPNDLGSYALPYEDAWKLFQTVEKGTC